MSDKPDREIHDSDGDEFDELNDHDESVHIKEADSEEPKPKSAWPIVVIILALAAMVCVTICVTLGNKGNGQTSAKNPSSKLPTTAQTGAPNTACASGLSVTYLDPHTNGDNISGGVPQDPAQNKPIVVADSTDPSVFAWYYNDSSLVKVLHQPQIDDPWTLVDKPHQLGACWTPAGAQMYNTWKPLFLMTNAGPAPLPATGVNTGVGTNGKPTQTVGNIPAGTATKYVYLDANGNPVSESTVRNECGNIVSAAPYAGVPYTPAPGETTEETTESTTSTETTTSSTETTSTTPSTTTSTPSTTTSTPTTSQPKSTNPNDYLHLSDAPKASVSTSAAPPRVPSQAAGTTPVNAPAPTQVRAPNATPAKPTITTRPPVQQAAPSSAPATGHKDPDAKK
ncbi:MAG TPA: hypothetical protein VMT96_00560 [Candidatus Bathyarchaeia archaeon]|nr:hypothetical protein [Candidatus Bathyarchaeia archaeon]